MPAESVEFRAFIGQPRASERTKLEDNPSFAGTVAAFGMADMEMESKSASKSFDLELNISDHVKTSLAEDATELQLKIVAFNGDAEPVSADRLDIQEIELIFE